MDRQDAPGAKRSKHHGQLLGHAFVHTVIDDRSRVAYAEIHDDETAVTAAGVLQRAVDWFAARSVTVERVPSDNGGCHRSKLWKRTCAELDVKARFTRPYRPQTNGKIERIHRTMAAELAFGQHHQSEHARRTALSRWLHTHNRPRQHSAIRRNVPFSRLTNVPGQYT